MDELLGIDPSPDDVGRHNAQIENSKLRIIEGATWKKQDIAVIIPASHMINAKVVLSWMNLIYPPNNGVVRIMTQGLEVGEAYSKAVDQVLTHPVFSKFKYILTLEHDNVPPGDGVLKLLKYMEDFPEYDAISGLYWTKGEQGVPQLWGDVKDPVVNFRPQPPTEEVQECYGIGMGFALWRLEMFRDKNIPRPFFKTVVSMDGVGTQDLYFCKNARMYGHRFAVATKVLVGHIDVNSGIIW